MTFDEAVNAGRLDAQEALALFDSLPTVELGFMRGTWKGSELHTGHPMDGMLGATGWYGKRFVDEESVHPLLFYTEDRASVFPVDPRKWPSPTIRGLVGPHRAAVETEKFKARLRLTVYRGKVSATMIYDDWPTNDVFRQVDANTLLGVMDARGMAAQYFFVLRRDGA
ncbi:DUF4334 domain-containing protein [Myxococcus llanfairpwllgwyngyllgogerychwyrndrobwllllantysiliogogogochensis]|uniref:DUF4334 domain-containing protein n=1 Tax=Myxococcus llanfairpwllgwyngyllgogerychwyrndrobwllllantysiliogogogochensis TaxID=2590453 RepID=A0A540WL46_9BACT|nr:DUF4334 domain-containing protein [Myxococcus llanfairpwllgwyngyllgogerychwyrndrobwllllantysiliogogogochensis]TQF09547.1 DUF4334 domain-containing protein [Myxococcus llanfairpwllgwyngyllgogerychwyrndrobwllllantysiliogogogochensis]